MLFNSYLFWCFYAVVFALYRVLPHKAQNYLLLAASYVFYGNWDVRFLGLLVFSTVLDYVLALLIDRAQTLGRKRALLTISCVTSLSLLGFFKYWGFFATEFTRLLNEVGIDVSIPLVHVLLPVGISFYTFQTMSYVIDVYRGECKVVKDFTTFALFVSFFPHLVAGPIVRASNLCGQIARPRVLQAGDFSQGLYLVMMGLFKKIVVADNLAWIANGVFRSEGSQLSGVDCLVGVYAFAFQVYGDFSGYSSIARGVAKWMGFDLTENFNLPYLATSPSDFWNRWHISLSKWLRDYVYIPLGGNRHGAVQTYRNLMITMLLGGFWHGAGWTYIAWGAFHGAILCLYRLFERRGERTALTWTRHVTSVLLMFHLVCASWLLFRATSIQQAAAMATKICTDFRVTHLSLYGFAMIAFFATPLLLFECWLERRKDLLALTKVHWSYRAIWYAYLAGMILVFHPIEQNEFIYFQF